MGSSDYQALATHAKKNEGKKENHSHKRPKKFQKNHRSRRDYTNLRCYTCDEKGHFSRDCTKNKGSSKKKKRHHAHTAEDDEPTKKRTREDSSSDEECVLWSRRIQPVVKNNFLSSAEMDNKFLFITGWIILDQSTYSSSLEESSLVLFLVGSSSWTVRAWCLSFLFSLEGPLFMGQYLEKWPFSSYV